MNQSICHGCGGVYYGSGHACNGSGAVPFDQQRQINNGYIPYQYGDDKLEHIIKVLERIEKLLMEMKK